MELATLDSSVPREQFAGRLARLVNLSDSIKISTAQHETGVTTTAATPGASDAARQEYGRVRTSLRQAVQRSFKPSTGPSRIRLPQPGPPRWTDSAQAWAPYLKFYLAHQGQFDASVQGLHLRIRTMAEQLSPELARLTALDLALADTLYPSARKFFGAIPELLSRRFQQLLQHSQPTASEAGEEPGEWENMLDRFCTETHGLLLAELDARLLPVLGLVEAINEETDK